jgi:hypothetical protein
MSLLSAVGSFISKAAQFAHDNQDVAIRIVELGVKIFEAKDPVKSLTLAEEAVLKESYQHGFKPTPDRKPLP